MKYLQKILLLTLFGCLLISSPLPSVSQTVELTDGERVRNIAYGFVGTKEVGNNGGYWVTRFLKSVGLRPGNPWCAAFVSFCLDSAGVKSLRTRSGLARHFITKNKTIRATKVIQSGMKIPTGSIVVWRRGNTISGHVGFVDQWTGNSGTTIEGNTSSGRSGNQWNGGGVWHRRRTINPYNHFRITDFALLKQN